MIRCQGSGCLDVSDVGLRVHGDDGAGFGRDVEGRLHGDWGA